MRCYTFIIRVDILRDAFEERKSHTSRLVATFPSRTHSSI